MSLPWSMLLPGVVLLLFPADLLLSAKVRLRTFESFRSLENSPLYRPWWWVPALWLDPLRAFAGTWLASHAWISRDTGLAALPDLGYWILVATLVVGVVLQMLTRREEDVVLPPMGYLIGAAAALVPWPAALLAGIASLTLLFALRSFPPFFIGGFVGFALLGFGFEVPVIRLAPVLGIFLLPLLVALLTGRAFELPTRNQSGPPDRPPPAA